MKLFLPALILLSLFSLSCGGNESEKNSENGVIDENLAYAGEKCDEERKCVKGASCINGVCKYDITSTDSEKSGDKEKKDKESNNPESESSDTDKTDPADTSSDDLNHPDSDMDQETGDADTDVEASDSDGMGPSETNHRPTADAGPDKSIINNITVTIDGSGSRDDDGDKLSYSWKLKAPEGSMAELSCKYCAKPSLLSDIPGEYELSLIVSDGQEKSEPDTVQITVVKYHPIDFHIVEAEYNNKNNSLVMISSDKKKSLIVFYPETGKSESIAFPLTPTTFAIHPDGKRAIVGHNAYISIVNLEGTDGKPEKLGESFPVGFNVRSIIPTESNTVFVVPSYNSNGNVLLRSVDIQERRENNGSDIAMPITKNNAVLKKQPGQPFVYLVNNDDSVSILSIKEKTLGDSETFSFSQMYTVREDLWFSEEGNRIFTKSSGIFSTPTSEEGTVGYRGSFEKVGRIKQMTHSTKCKKAVIISEENDKAIKTFSEPFYSFLSEITMPSLFFNNREIVNSADFLFFKNTGEKVYIILNAEDDSSNVNNYGVAELPLK